RDLAARLAQVLQRLLAVGETDQLAAAGAEDVGEEPAHLRLVVDGDDDVGHQNSARLTGVASDENPPRSLGRTTVMMVPRSTSLRTGMRPWCAARTGLAPASPRPEPRVLVVKPGAKMRAMSARGMPGPRSRISISTVGVEPAATSARVKISMGRSRS